MKRVFYTIIFILFTTLVIPLYADQDTEEILRAIVKVHAEIPADAFTATALGTERQGSGVVIDKTGHVLTIGYLIIEAESITVTGPNGETVQATFVGYDFDSGFGLLRMENPLNTKPIKFGQSSGIEEGNRLLVAGYGERGSVQAAIVISRSEFAGYWEYLLEDAIYASPPHPDFGGAALISHKGLLLGIGSIYTQMTLRGIGTIPCNMFVPIDLLGPILEDLMTSGRPHKQLKPWLGLNAEESYGRIFVLRVTSGGPAAKAGLQPGDLILSVNGKAVKGLSDFYRKVWALGSAGIEVYLSVLQGTKIREITVNTGDRYQFLKLSPKTRKGKLVKLKKPDKTLF